MDRRVQKIIELLHSELHKRLPVAGLAACVGLRTSRLEHLFKHHMKVSIREFVKRQRIRRAADLIAETEGRISEICYAVGFTDPSNFNHAFKQYYGMSPRAYRNAALRVGP
jgi:transcriptional regulator GlxA family with amidase domain